MRIGIDIDGTLTNTFDNLELKIKQYADAHGLLVPLTDDEYEDFLISNSYDFLKNATIKKDAIDVLNDLKKLNYEIIIVTHRNTEYDKRIPNMTMEYLKEHHVSYDDIIFGAYNKGQVCLERQISLLVDDMDANIISCKEHGVKALKYDESGESTLLPIARSWQEVKKYILKEANHE